MATAPQTPTPAKTALMLMDYQDYILENYLSPDQAQGAVGAAGRLLAYARAQAVPIIHIMVAFEAGYPSVSPNNVMFAAIKREKMGLLGQPGTAITQALAPRPGETVVVKNRVGAFTGTNLAMILRAQNINTLVMGGVITSGVVMSTLRQAFDLDYTPCLVGPACGDATAETNQVLLGCVPSWLADVVDIEGGLARLA
ncbi:cysteine hydrolase [Formicincola oecophyllae]|uniref:Cysteine hydrolase n=1 Tax=Formicincola oecophyllae TaxID=2558361 RepID=A0A4Y6UCD0_9PROT|nr:isochorismatase family cysteine hydrolase [Formicincola oecophyllae]QDH14218.1 cysteine hydrolase [Formicincola oecophyllae]